MLNFINIDKILFIDIETVPQFRNFEELDDRWKELWTKKSLTLSKNNETPDELYNRAGIYAEFGKIICISTGFLIKTGNEWSFRVKSFYGENEKEILKDFSSLLNKYFSDTGKLLCAHNGKEFDFPYTARRVLINSLPLPAVLDLSAKKPWEVPHIDTMELWKFGDYKSYTSLDLLAAVLDIASPKDDIDGSMVFDVYYNEPQGIERIKKYCEKDVITLARVLLKMAGFEVFREEDIVILG